MTVFWIVAAILIVVALLFVLPPLWRKSAGAGEGDANRTLNVAVYRDQLTELEADRRAGTLSDEQYERARLELERRLLEDVAAAAPETARSTSRAPAVVVGIAVPVLAVGLSFAVGTPRALAPLPAASPHGAGAGKPPSAEQVEAMVAKLAERMKQNPDDAQGWAMLGRSYAVMNRYDDSAAAYAKAVERVPDNPHLLADYADALAMSQGQSLIGEPEKLIMRALKIDPNHVKSLALAGTIAFDKKDFNGAIKHWEKMATLVPPDTEMFRNVQGSIAEARSRAGGGAPPPMAKGPEKTAPEKAAPEKSMPEKSTATTAGNGISGTVTLAPALAAKVSPNDTVFIFARAAEGPRMPLAIQRKKAGELPIKFALDDSMAMNPASNLSSAKQVIVGARISKSGNAMPQPGDLQGATKPVSNNGKNLTVVIDTEVQ
jgi:cytochrome c-type biogenesis protein CcmH